MENIKIVGDFIVFLIIIADCVLGAFMLHEARDDWQKYKNTKDTGHLYFLAAATVLTGACILPAVWGIWLIVAVGS